MKAPRAARTFLEYAGTIAALVLVWAIYVAWRHVPAYLLPTPQAVWQSLGQLFASGEIWPNLGHTVSEVAIGFAIGSLLGGALGFLLGKSSRVEEIVAPYVFFFQTAPKIALAPLFVLWFGLGLTSQVLLVVSLVFFPVMVGAMLGLRSVAADLRQLARLLRMSPWESLLQIELPSSLPEIYAGMRIGIIQAVIGAIVAEWISGKAGLGYLMVYGGTTYNSPLLVAAIVLTVALGIAVHQIIVWAERRSLGWRDEA